MNAQLKPVSLIPSNISLAEFVSPLFVVSPEPGTPVERLLEKDYWASCIKKLTRGARIVAISESDLYFVELLVREHTPHYVSVTLLRKIDLPPVHPSEGEAILAGHSVEFLGPNELWGALRGGQILRSGFPSKTDAIDFLVNLGRAGVTGA